MTLDLIILEHYSKTVSNIQFLPGPDIKKLMVEHGAIARIEKGQIRRKQVDRVEAKSVRGGDSIICSYYYGAEYIDTAHKLMDASGKTVHCDVKRFVIGGIAYRIPKLRSRHQP
ncbi:MAG: hypothetical protein HY673_02620 [Chloroflexi bacterium]|nr:hypothetical protein [Chloroflexota bacterium]